MTYQTVQIVFDRCHNCTGLAFTNKAQLRQCHSCWMTDLGGVWCPSKLDSFQEHARSILRKVSLQRNVLSIISKFILCIVAYCKCTINDSHTPTTEFSSKPSFSNASMNSAWSLEQVTVLLNSTPKKVCRFLPAGLLDGAPANRPILRSLSDTVFSDSGAASSSEERRATRAFASGDNC